MGACVADIDGDGWDDLCVTGLGGNHLYRNNHDGTFADITERAGVSGGSWSTGCGSQTTIAMDGWTCSSAAT